LNNNQELILDKEETLDALIRNVKDQQRESQVITTSVRFQISITKNKPRKC